MVVEKNIPLQAFNTFRIVAKAHALARITHEQDVRDLLADPEWAAGIHAYYGTTPRAETLMN